MSITQPTDTGFDSKGTDLSALKPTHSQESVEPSLLQRTQRSEPKSTKLSQDSTQKVSHRRPRAPTTKTPPIQPTFSRISTTSRGLMSNRDKRTDKEQVSSVPLLEMVQAGQEELNDEEEQTQDSVSDSRSLPNPRGQWANQLECILTVLVHMVGYGNIWRFPLLTAQAGGGAFLFPYLIFLLLAGIPMAYLEMCLGQYSSLGPAGVFGNMVPFLQGIGWALLLSNMLIAMYYNCLSAWSLFYLFASFQKELPWGSCDHEWNTWRCFSLKDNQSCREKAGKGAFFFNKSCHSGNETPVHESYATARENHSLQSPAVEFFYDYLYERNSHSVFYGSLQWHLMLCLLLAWLLTLFYVVRGVRSMGLAVYFNTAIIYLTLIIMVIFALVQEGADKGVAFYVTFNASSLADMNLWTSAAIQVFYSLNIAQGTIITLTSYNRFKNNCFRDALITCWMDTFTSAAVGFAIFPSLGFIAESDNRTVRAVIHQTNDTALVFVVVSRVISMAPAAPAWSVVVFATFLVTGLSTQSVMVEQIVTAICDQFPILIRKRWLVACVSCVVFYLLGLPLCTQRGYRLFRLFDKFSTFPAIYLGLFQLVCVAHVYGSSRFMSNVAVMFGNAKSFFSKLIGPTGKYWFFTWMFVCPLILASSIILWRYEISKHERLNNKEHLFGNFMVTAPLFVVIFVASGRLIHTFWSKKSFIELFTPTPLWRPLHDRLTSYNQNEGQAAKLDLRTKSHSARTEPSTSKSIVFSSSSKK